MNSTSWLRQKVHWEKHLEITTGSPTNPKPACTVCVCAFLVFPRLGCGNVWREIDYAKTKQHWTSLLIHGPSTICHEVREWDMFGIPNSTSHLFQSNPLTADPGELNHCSLRQVIEILAPRQLKNLANEGGTWCVCVKYITPRLHMNIVASSLYYIYTYLYMVYTVHVCILWHVRMYIIISRWVVTYPVHGTSI